MKEFDELLEVVDHLLGPNGCPWDQVQTMVSVREHVLEEVSELIEAIDLNDDNHMKEELGDLFYNAVFLSRLAQKEGRFALKEVIQDLKEKLIRRHPHVFGDETYESFEKLGVIWDRVKQEEKGKLHRESALDGIPKTLPPLAKSQKMIRKMEKAVGAERCEHIVSSEYKTKFEGSNSTGISFKTEEELGDLLWSIAVAAQKNGLESEQALRAVIAKKEQAFREFESLRAAGQ